MNLYSVNFRFFKLMGTGASTTVYIQGNYLDNKLHNNLKELVRNYIKDNNSQQNNGIFIAPSTNKFGFTTISITLAYLRENKHEIDKVLNTLNGGFIRMSTSINFSTYKEYK